MKLPRVRFTVRRMMVAVAVASLALGLSQWMRRRSGRFDEIHRRHVRASFEIAYSSGPWSDKEARMTYHWRMITKYERAARYPFLPVAPDPPEPE